MQKPDVAFEHALTFRKQFAETVRLQMVSAPQKPFEDTQRLRIPPQASTNGQQAGERCPGCRIPLGNVVLQPLEIIRCNHCGKEFRAFEKFGQFRLQRFLGAGGMGVVYQALDLESRKPVALKLLREEFQCDAEFLEQIAKQIALTNEAVHSPVVKVYATGVDHGLFYIAMEFVNGGTLADVIEARGAISEWEALYVAIQVVDGLREAYYGGLLHRALKPANILLSQDGSVKISDFGVILQCSMASMDESDTPWASVWYIAPEAVECMPEDFRSDIYSLGALLYHALTGHPPFLGETPRATALRRLERHPLSIQAYAPTVTSKTAGIVSRMLRRAPERRYQSYDDLLQELETACQQAVRVAHVPKPKARFEWLLQKIEWLLQKLKW